MRIWCVMCVLFVSSLYDPEYTVAHSADEVMKTFDRGPMPKELLEATKELEATVGQKSSREDAHARQHELLEQYSRAQTERKCTEALTDISKLDTAIVRSRDQGNTEEENNLRQIRDDRTEWVKGECPGTSVDKYQAPQP
jgi:hypothetical protein